MKDILLLTAIEIAEAEEPVETDITLVVGGFLISGFVISAKKYFTHHPLSDEFNKVFERVKTEQAATEGVRQEECEQRSFIHLRDAKYFTPGQNPIPGNIGVHCRVKIESVLGFSFGLLKADKV